MDTSGLPFSASYLYPESHSGLLPRRLRLEWKREGVIHSESGDDGDDEHWHWHCVSIFKHNIAETHLRAGCSHCTNWKTTKLTCWRLEHSQSEINCGLFFVSPLLTNCLVVHVAHVGRSTSYISDACQSRSSHHWLHSTYTTICVVPRTTTAFGDSSLHCWSLCLALSKFLGLADCTVTFNARYKYMSKKYDCLFTYFCVARLAVFSVGSALSFLINHW